MSLEVFLFWFLSALLVFSAVMVIIQKNPINAILWLLVLFLSISGHYVLLNAQFLAIINIIVYAGAILVLFLFVLMLINVKNQSHIKIKYGFTFLATLISFAVVMVLFLLVRQSKDITNNSIELGEGNMGSIENLGNLLFTKFTLPFEISSILFLIGIIGAVVLTKKEKIKW